MKSMKNRNLKGSVLLAVVSVMSLLIIFMGTTLVLAAAANNRAHRSYTTSQAEYTARAALDSFVTAMETNEAVAAAVKDLAGPTEIDVKFNDTSIGHIGYYKADGSFEENKMLIEKAKDPKNPSQNLEEWVWTEKNEWMKVPVYKITSTARVGKETKTMSLYIRQKRPEESEPADLKGLQSAGIVEGGLTEGYFSGAYVVGAVEDGTSKYNLNNGSTLDDAQAFINGSLNVTGSGLQIVVNSSDSQTVIMGDLHLENNQFVKFDDYDMKKDYTQKNIPYLFVDGKITLAGSTDFEIGYGAKPEKEQPYNVFAGSAEILQPKMYSDLYLMNEGATSKIGVGNSGYNLYKWSKSTFNKTSDQFDSVGGSVYCNGNLELGCTIGDRVYVEGDLNILDGTVINGNVIVGGKMTITGQCTLNGTVHVDGDLVFGMSNAKDVTVNNNIEVGGTISATAEAKSQFIDAEKLNMGAGAKIYGNVDASAIKAKEGTDKIAGKADINSKPASFKDYAEHEIYPKDMTKEVIYAKVEGGSEVKTEGSFIRTLADVQEALGVVDNGSGDYGFDTDKYITTLPDTSDETAWNKENGGSDKTVTITKDTVLSGNYTRVKFNIDESVDIVFDDAAYFMQCEFVLKDNKSINFYVPKAVAKGDFWDKLGNKTTEEKGVVFEKTSVLTSSVSNTKKVNESDGCSVFWYGEEGSKIRVINNGVLIGAFRCPKTDFISPTAEGLFDIEYTDHTNKTKTKKPVIIGNALFKSANTSNNMAICNTNAGNGSDGNTITTALGYFESSYYTEY